jgi:hypothetical protein
MSRLFGLSLIVLFGACAWLQAQPPSKHDFP